MQSISFSGKAGKNSRLCYKYGCKKQVPRYFVWVLQEVQILWDANPVILTEWLVISLADFLTPASDSIHDYLRLTT